MQSSSKNQSLQTPPFTAVIGQMAQSFVIGLLRTVQMTAMGRHYANVLIRDIQPKQNEIRIPDDSFRQLRTNSFFFDRK